MNTLNGVKIVVNNYMQDRTIDEDIIKLDMFDQWKIWGWKLWRYCEIWHYRMDHGPLIIQANGVLYCSPRTMQILGEHFKESHR